MDVHPFIKVERLKIDVIIIAKCMISCTTGVSLGISCAAKRFFKTRLSLFAEVGEPHVHWDDELVFQTNAVLA